MRKQGQFELGHDEHPFKIMRHLKACTAMKDLHNGSKLHAYVREHKCLEKNAYIGSFLISMYAKCGALAKAQQVLEELPSRDVVSWSALIAGYARKGQGEEALKCFDDMLSEGHSPDAVTFACVLKACGSIGAAVKGEEIRKMIVSLGILEKHIVLGNSLVDMYVKCGALAKAQQVLKELPIRDVVSWSTIISGYAQNGQGDEALKCFDDMINEGHSPDVVSFACVLKACGSIRAAIKGEEIHANILSLGILEKDIIIRNSIVDMYVKCGLLSKAHQVHKELPVHDVVSWNALIAGYTEQGQGEKALNCFDSMLGEGHSPTAVTFISVLKACGCIGAAAKGEQIHANIVNLGMLEKDIVLGTSLVDMYVKCGALTKAQQVLEEIPASDAVSWSALISGFAQQGQNVEVINCFERMQLNQVKPNVVTLSVVLNACNHSGLLNQAETYFSGMSTKYNIQPCLEHYCCMADVFGRAGKFDKALSVIAEMPYDKCLPSWVALLGACLKWVEVKIGRLAFERALLLDKSNATVYVLMADIYVAAGMQAEAHKIDVMRVSNKAWKKPGHWWTDQTGKSALFLCWGHKTGARKCYSQNGYMKDVLFDDEKC